MAWIRPLLLSILILTVASTPVQATPTSCQDQNIECVVECLTGEPQSEACLDCYVKHFCYEHTTKYCGARHPVTGEEGCYECTHYPYLLRMSECRWVYN